MTHSRHHIHASALSAHWQRLKDIFEYVRSLGWLKYFKAQTYVDLCRLWFRRFRDSPMFLFYRYLWRTDRQQLFMTLFVNYVLPVLFETLPWYLSRRKLASKLRDLRNQLHHSMIHARGFSSSDALSYAGMTMIHVLLDITDRTLRNRVAAVNKWLVRRMVLERLLFCEVSTLDSSLAALGTGEGAESRIQNDINSVLNLFHYTLPALCSSSYAAAREGFDLWKRRNQIDVLSLIRPSVVELGSSIGDSLRKRIGKAQQNTVPEPSSPTQVRAVDACRKVPPLWNSLLDALVDVQLNNMQFSQLERFDEAADADVAKQEGTWAVIERVWSSYASRSVVDFVSEIMVVSHVMRKRGLTHEQYRRIQIDIDHVLSLVRRAWRYGRSAITVFEQQDRVSALLTIPSFLEEEGHGSKVNHYLTFKREIRVSRIQFAYPNVSENALDFTDGPCDITFEPGKVYGVVGQNRSGKSTLMHLVCKLHKPSAGTISLDGIPYDQVSRIALRNLIAYVPQRAFLFAGSIADNIRMGYELATDDEVYEAARMAGVFAYAEFSKPSDVSSSASGSSSTAPSASVSAVDESTQAPARSRTPTSDNESEHDSPTSGSDSDLPASPEETRAHERAVLEMVVQPRGHNLSGGFAQSVALARAFLRKDARIVVLDESMSAMDPFKKRVVIIPQMMQHIRARGLTLIMVSHEMQQVRDLCDCIYVLENGRLCCCGTHRDMLLNRSEAYMRLVGDVPAEAVEAPNSLVRPTEVLEYSV